jgi:hypothetical protein
MISCQICLEYFHLDHIGLDEEECDKIRDSEDLALMICPGCIGTKYYFLESYRNDSDVVVDLASHQKSAKKSVKESDAKEKTIKDVVVIANLTEEKTETSLKGESSEETKENIEPKKELNSDEPTKVNAEIKSRREEDQEEKIETNHVKSLDEGDKIANATESPPSKSNLKRKLAQCVIDWSYLERSLPSSIRKPRFLRENWTENICLCDECQKHYKKIGLDDVIKTCDQNVRNFLK